MTILTPTLTDNWLPSGNPIVYTFSTTTGNPRLSYYIYVYVNNILAVKMKYPVYDRNQMNIDVSSIVNDYLQDIYVNDNINYSTSAFTPPAIGEVCSLHVDAEEEYWNGSNMVIGNLYTTKNIYVWRAAADFQESRRLFDFSRKFELDGNTYDKYGKFLGAKNYIDVDVAAITNPVTTHPEIFKNLYPISKDTKRTIQFFTTNVFGVSYHTANVICYCYGSNMRVTKKLIKNIHAGNYTSFIDKIGCIPCDLTTLNGLAWDNYALASGVSPFIDPAEDKYYFITVAEKASTGSGIPNWNNPIPSGNKWVGFEIADCDKYDVYDILYKTCEGGWWQIRTDMKNYNETEVKTNIKYNTWDTPAFTLMPNSKRFKQTMHTNANGTITLNTDWINNQGIIDEIEEMIISPQIFIVKEGTTPIITPVILKDKTYRIANKQQDKMIQYSFEFEEAYNKNTII